MGREREILFVVILAALCLVVFFCRLGARPLWDIDEGMHAATAKDMVLTGDWITPRHNGEVFSDKPPLLNWLTALSFMAFGFTEFAARLPVALLGLGCVAVTYLLGRRIFEPTTAFLGSAILATSAEFIVLARAVVHDMCLTFFVTLTLWLFYGGLQAQARQWRWLLPGYAAAGFAVLAKGPIGVLLPALVVGLFLLVERRLGSIRRMQIAWGIPIFLAIAAPWYVAISLRVESYASEFFLGQNLGSFFSGESRHPEPIYFYVLMVFAVLFPWSCFLPTAIVHAVRDRGRHLTAGIRFLLLWCGVIFVFFSLARSKLAPYILPLFPAASLLIGRAWHDALKSLTRELHRGFVLSWAPVLGLGLFAVGYVRISPPVDLKAEYGIDLGHLYLASGVLAVGATAAFCLLLARRYWSFFAAVVTTTVAFLLVFLVVLVPVINPYRSTKRVAQQIDEMLPSGAPIPFYWEMKDSALFYTNRKVVVFSSIGELRSHLDSDGQVFCVIDERNLEWVAPLRDLFEVVTEHGDKLIISNRASPQETRTAGHSGSAGS